LHPLPWPLAPIFNGRTCVLVHYHYRYRRHYGACHRARSGSDAYRNRRRGSQRQKRKKREKGTGATGKGVISCCSRDAHFIIIEIPSHIHCWSGSLPSFGSDVVQQRRKDPVLSLRRQGLKLKEEEEAKVPVQHKAPPTHLVRAQDIAYAKLWLCLSSAPSASSSPGGYVFRCHQNRLLSPLHLLQPFHPAAGAPSAPREVSRTVML
jgi:hypothetical protein